MKPKSIVGFILFYMTLSLSAFGSSVDSIRSPKLWLETQNKLGQTLLKENHEFEKAVAIFKSAHNFAVSQNLSNQFPEICIGFGIALYKNGNIQKAHNVLQEILPEIDKVDLKVKAEVNQILGMTFVFKNKFPEGYKFQMEALKYYSDIGDTQGQMSVYYDLGANFGTQGQHELSLENYKKGIALAKEIRDTKMIILGITAIGGTWASMNNFEKALSYVDESIELATEINDQEEIAWAAINRGHILIQLDKFKEAEESLKQAYDLSFVIGNKLLTAYSLEQMSDLFLKQNNSIKALSFLDESYIIYQDLGQMNSVKNIISKYAEIYFQQKNYVKYKEYTDQFIALKDSIYSNDMMESMADLKQDFEMHKMERENKIALLTKDQELASARSYFIIAITVGVVVVVFLLLYFMHSRNKATEERNKLLAAKNAEILRQNKFLADSNSDLEKFAYIISHDLKEPLRNINGFTKLLTNKLKNHIIDENINEYAKYITNSTEQMEELLNGLLEYSKIGVNKSETKSVDFSILVEKVVGSLKIQLGEKNCIVIKEDNLPIISCRSTQLSQVYQNLIANAIKFSDKNGNEITIGAEDKGEEFQFYIKDKGIGIDPDYQKDIFVVFKRLHNRGTYSGSGIGLATCKKIVEDHGGKIWVESEKGEGSSFFFTLPKESIFEKEVSVSETPKKLEQVLEPV